MRREVTRRQHEVLAFVIQFCRDHNYAPTQAEIGKAIGVSKERARQLLVILGKKGKIERIRYARTIVVVKQ